MDQSTSPTGSSASDGPTGSSSTATGASTPSSTADPVDTAGTPDDATSTGRTDVGSAGAATSGGADATVTRVDADDPDEQDDTEDDGEDHAEDDAEAEADRQRRLEEFAHEHDPEKHDLSAGEEFRQRGDWTADAAGGEQKWDADGNLVEGSSPAVPQATGGDGGDAGDAGDGDAGDRDGGDRGDGGSGTTGGRRTSSFEEIRDGGYSVGSAAPLDDGAMPLGHPVRGWESSKTYATPGDGPDDAGEPDVWFTDEGAAERAGFHRA